MIDLVVDAKNLIYRIVFGAGENSPEITPYLFLKNVEEIRTKLGAYRVFVVWDGRRCEWRRSVYPEYKEKKHNEERKAYLDSAHAEEDFLKQKILPNIPYFQIHCDYEADDAIYALIEDNPHSKFVICSVDRDFYQMLDRAKLYSFHTEEVYDSTKFKNEYEFPCSLWPMHQALVGDPSDCIAGVKGIGIVKAGELMRQFVALGRGYSMGEVRRFISATLGEDHVDTVVRNIRLMAFSLYPKQEEVREMVYKQLMEYSLRCDIVRLSTNLRKSKEHFRYIGRMMPLFRTIQAAYRQEDEELEKTLESLLARRR